MVFGCFSESVSLRWPEFLGETSLLHVAAAICQELCFGLLLGSLFCATRHACCAKRWDELDACYVQWSACDLCAFRVFSDLLRICNCGREVGAREPDRPPFRLPIWRRMKIWNFGTKICTFIFSQSQMVTTALYQKSQATVFLFLPFLTTVLTRCTWNASVYVIFLALRRHNLTAEFACVVPTYSCGKQLQSKHLSIQCSARQHDIGASAYINHGELDGSNHPWLWLRQLLILFPLDSWFTHFSTMNMALQGGYRQTIAMRRQLNRSKHNSRMYMCNGSICTWKIYKRSTKQVSRPSQNPQNTMDSSQPSSPK